MLFVNYPLCFLPGHQSILTKRRPSSSTSNLWDDTSWVPQDWLWGMCFPLNNCMYKMVTYYNNTLYGRRKILLLFFTQGFATLIREWPGELYNNMAIVQAVNEHLKKDPTNSMLLTTLAELWVNAAKACKIILKAALHKLDCSYMYVCSYTYDQRYDRALEIYLKLRHKDVYQLIHKHNLFSAIKDKIVLLMDFDKEVKQLFYFFGLTVRTFVLEFNARNLSSA